MRRITQRIAFRSGDKALMSHIIGIDVGGTFTDLVAVDARGEATYAKAPTTPADPGDGLFDGLDELARRLGVYAAASCCAARDASSTAPRSPPMRCSSARARGSGCSRPQGIATSSRCARGSRRIATTC